MSPAPGASLNRHTLWGHDDAFAFNLLCAALDAWGAQALDWAPETVWLEASHDFGHLTPDNFHKLMAARFVLTDDGFFRSPADFNRVCLSLCGDPQGHLAGAAQCAWGVTEGLLIRPPERDQEDVFSDEVRGYVGAVCDREGLADPPDVLRIGLRDRSHWDNLAYDWADSPEMFAGIRGFQAEKTRDIDRLIKRRLRRLLTQLGGLGLTHSEGAEKKAVARLLAALPDPEADSPLPSEV